MNWFHLQPEDVLLFRDSRPFAAGEEHRAQGQFPPSPMPIAGAFRSQLLQTALKNLGRTFEDYATKNDPDILTLHKQYGTAEHLGELQLRGPLVYRAHPETGVGEPIFPQPADLIGGGVLAPMKQSPEDKKFTVYRNALQGVSPTSELPLLRLNTRQSDPAAQQESLPWLTLPQMIAYLTGKTELTGAGRTENLSEINPAVREERTGVALDYGRRAAQTGMLYEAQMQRPVWTPAAAYGLLVSSEGADLQEGCLPLGGEMRSVWVKRCQIDARFESLLSGEVYEQIIEAICRQEGRFRLSLLAPAIFERGWRPALFDETATFAYGGAATSKPVPIGGWDLARRMPKPLHLAVPAGAVYFGQIKNCTEALVRQWMKAFHFQTTLQAQEKNVYPTSAFFSQMGFGLTLMGSWQPVTTQED